MAGKVLLKCYGGCSQAAIIEELKNRGLWDPPSHGPVPFRPRRDPPSHPQGTLTATYDYRDATGAVIAVKGRFEWQVPGQAKPDKDFKWKRPGAATWSGGMSLTEIPLYGADLIAGSPPSQRVVFCEGEKAVEACRSAGLLAVCAGGGAGQQEFGDCLTILAGREVLLWPDNDVPGRKYMARIHAALRPIAHSVVTLQPTVDNEKDDAVEYFAGGGTVDALLANLAPLRPSVRYIEDDAITVDIPSEIGCITYAFTEIVHTPRDLSAELAVSIKGPGQPSEAMPTRLNVLSSSSIADFRRSLEGFFPPPEKNFWTASTIRAIALMRSAIRDNDGTVHVSQLTAAGPASYLIDTWLPEHRPTMWFGDGESGKTWLAIRAALAVALSGEMGGFSARSGGVLYLDWETDPATWRDRLLRTGRGLGYDDEEVLGAPIYYRHVSQPFADVIQSVRQRIAAHAIRFVIVDSVSAACGGPPEDSVVAQRFINGYNRLGNTTLLAIGHISKGSDTHTPFGSIMWRNFFRMLSYVEKANVDDAAEVVDVGMYCRKLNDGPRPRPQGWRFTFDDAARYVVIDTGDIAETPDLATRLPLWSRIQAALLKHGRLTLKELATELDAKEASIRRVLETHLKEIDRLSSGPGRGHEMSYGMRSTLAQ